MNGQYASAPNTHVSTSMVVTSPLLMPARAYAASGCSAASTIDQRLTATSQHEEQHERGPDHGSNLPGAVDLGGRSRDRTCDHLVVSEVLYR